MTKGKSFRIKLIFIAFSVIGLAFLPMLPVQLLPSPTTNKVSVNYAWASASGRVIENGVTQKLEALFAQLSGVRNISSKSSFGFASIEIEYDKDISKELFRFELSSVIKRVFPELPKGVSYPKIAMDKQSNSGTDERPLLTYAVTGNMESSEIQQSIEDKLIPMLSIIEGVGQIDIFGGVRPRWEIIYNADKLTALSIGIDDLISTLSANLKLRNIGSGYSTKNSGISGVVFLPDAKTKQDWKKIKIKTGNNEFIPLTKIVTIRKAMPPPNSYYRINGLTTINLNIYSSPNANQIVTRNKINKTIEAGIKNLPPSITLNVLHDAAQKVEKELSDLSTRTLVTLCVLLIFILLVNKSINQSLLVFISLIVIVLLSCILYYVFRIEIHTFSIAGIAVSLGLIIDNSIIVIDNQRFKRNSNVIIPVVAATLTSIGSLCVIFFMGEAIQSQLADFAWVIIINLTISVVVAFYFIPAFSFRNHHVSKKRNSLIKLRKLIRLLGKYKAIISFLSRKKKYAFAVIILMFGLPIFLVPNSISEEIPFNQLYNRTIGADFFSEKVRPYIEKAFGGSLRLFVDEVLTRRQLPRRVSNTIYLRVNVPIAGTVAQLNNVMKRFEKEAKRYKAVNQIVCNVNNSENASMSVEIKKQYADTGSPFEILQALTVIAQEQGGINISLSFRDIFINDNESWGKSINFMAAVYGYNYDKLLEMAKHIKQKLERHKRVFDVAIGDYSMERKVQNFNVLISPKYDKMAASQISTSEVFSYLKVFSDTDQPTIHYFDGKNNQQIILKSDKSLRNNLWLLENEAIKTPEAQTRLSQIADISENFKDAAVTKENQEYIVMITFLYTGAEKFGSQYLAQVFDEMKSIFPVGYRAKELPRYWFLDYETKDLASAIFLVLAIIFFVCSILFESIRQPFVIIFTIPFSLIGLFIVFWFFDVPFGYGGFGAVVVLSGLSVNAAIHVLNEYNSIDKQKKRNRTKNLIKALQRKITPIFLTVASTIIGFLPFIVGNSIYSFWFQLAVGTVAGLVFSLMYIVFVLPLFIFEQDLH